MLTSVKSILRVIRMLCALTPKEVTPALVRTGSRETDTGANVS